MKNSSTKTQFSMKKVAIGLLLLFSMATVFESCSSKMCPAYNSYPRPRRA